MNIIEAWMKAKVGDTIERGGPMYRFSYEKKSTDICSDLYPAVDYAKLKGFLSADNWEVGKGPEPIFIGPHKVTDISPKGFKVGCQEVTWEQVDAILALKPKEEAQNEADRPKRYCR
jgi:hypothetical protein